MLAGCATAGAAQQDGGGARGDATPRVAVLAGTDASSADIATATRGRTTVELRRTGGAFEAQAEATRLAAEGYDTVIGIGAQARAAVSQADAGEVGAGTRWQPASR